MSYKNPADAKKYRDNIPVEKVMFTAARNRAKAKDIPFELEIKHIKIPKYCPVLGIELKKSTTGKPDDNSPSIDRIVPGRGYIKDNIEVISHKANRLKSNATLEEVTKVLAYMRRQEQAGKFDWKKDIRLY